MTVPPNLVGMKLGNYRLERLLGRGRMGVVYLARDEALLRPTAVKILSWSIPEQPGHDPEAWFLAEARSVARINHPSVVQIYSVAKHASYCYIAMEYVEGAPADAWIAKHGPFSPELATEILLQVAGALQAAHTSDVVHRDVKPENLLVKPDGTAKLGDFGMARHRTATGIVDVARAGTPYYTAPEIWRGSPANISTDIYALGATYFYLLTGQAPFQAQDLPGLIAAHQNADIPSITEIVQGAPPSCDQVIRRCLAKSPSDRFPSAQSVGWEARGLLRAMHAPAGGARREAATQAKERRGSQPSPGPTLESWAKQLGFDRQPFSDPIILEDYGKLEPFYSARRRIAEWVEERGGITVLLTGAGGSGRTTIAHLLLSEQSQRSPTAYHLWQGDRGWMQHIARSFGVVTSSLSSAETDLEGLLQQLERTQLGDAAPALLVLDDVVLASAGGKELNTLIQAARSTRYLNLVLVGALDLPAQLRAAGVDLSLESGTHVLSLPPLTLRESRRYIATWMRAALSRSAPQILVTADAIILAAHRSGGIPARLNHLVSGMLQNARRSQMRVLSSWDAWTAPLQTNSPPESEPRSQRPERWPPPDVLEILNRGRQELGLPQRRS